MLSVRGGARAVEFYKAAFGATEVCRVEDPGGAVVSRLSVRQVHGWRVGRVVDPFGHHWEIGRPLAPQGSGAG
jgi:PhnB protein